MDYEKFINYLKEKNISQKQLAELLELKEASISKWKTGKQNPTLENFIKILDILNVGADELLGRERPPAEESKEKLTEQQKYLIKLTNQFNDEYMEKLIEQAEMYAFRQKEKEKSNNSLSKGKSNAS